MRNGFFISRITNALTPLLITLSRNALSAERGKVPDYLIRRPQIKHGGWLLPFPTFPFFFSLVSLSPTTTYPHHS